MNKNPNRKEYEVLITDPKGLHWRPSNGLVQIGLALEEMGVRASIENCEGDRRSMTSIFEVGTLMVRTREKIRIILEGDESVLKEVDEEGPTHSGCFQQNLEYELNEKHPTV